MEAKLKLAFKKIFEKNLSKEKYACNEIQAAQDALAEVKKMKGAEDYNMFLYKYNNQIRGLKVFSKDLKRKKKEKVEEKVEEKEQKQEADQNKEEAPPTIPQCVEEMKPISEEIETIQEKNEENEENEEINNEDLEKMFSMFLTAMQNKKNKDEEVESEDDEEEIEEEIPEEIKFKPKPKPLPKPEQKRNSKQRPPAIETPSQRPKVVKEVKPVKPRKIPQGLKQKFQISALKFEQGEDAEPAEKRRKDYRNNKADRIKALRGMIF